MSHEPTPQIRVATLRRAWTLSALTVLAPTIAATALIAPTVAQGAVSPAAYRVGRLCGAPAPGFSGCLGLRLLARQPEAQPGAQVAAPAPSDSPGLGESRPKKVEYKKPWKGSLSPAEVLGAYSLIELPAPASTQTLALVDAYNDPTIEHDLAVFDEQYALPECTNAKNKCFTKVELQSKGKAPPNEAGWAQEISTDVELAHGLCPECRILLVEAFSNSNEDLEAAERKAEELGATEISNSWGGPEVGVTTEEDEHDAFDDPGAVIAAAAGDEGYLDWDAEEARERGYPDYPASSPHVVAVGGTRLELTASGAWKGETVWDGDGAGGGGCSTVLQAPPWQQSLPDWPAVGCGSRRAVADVSADADPYTGVSVYDSTPVIEEGVEYRGWTMIGGTSVATPIIAATYALAGGAGTEADDETVQYPARTLYENLAFDPSALHDVTIGSNGACGKGFDEFTGLSECLPAEEGESCSQQAICLARSGYDGPTGVGTPDGIAAFQPLSEADRQKAEEKQAIERAEEERRELEARELKERKEREAKEQAAVEQRTAEERAAEERRREEEETEERALASKAAEERRIAAEKKATEELKTATEKLLAEELAKSNGAATGSGQGTSGAGSPTAFAGSRPKSAVPILSGLTLTRGATAALSDSRPTADRIVFAFTLSLAARVRVALAKRVPANGRPRWQALPYARTIAAAKGHDAARLSARSPLQPGSYRLTLIPAHGVARTLVFEVR
jgi:hypothetical protein